MYFRSKFLLALLLPTTPALAGSSYCDDAAKLRNAVNYCHENLAYIEPAQKCRDRFLAVAKAKQEEIKKILAQDIRSSNGNAQSGNFQATDAVLTSADATLASLLAQGEDTYTEIEDYQYDFVLPLYDAEDFAQNPDDPKVQAEMRQEECYGIPSEELDNVKVDLDATISSLTQAKASVDKLLALSKIKGSDLGATNPKQAPLKGVGQGTAKQKAGTSLKGASDITGVQQDEDKQKQK